jgi:epoxyqueuosine reductase
MVPDCLLPTAYYLLYFFIWDLQVMNLIEQAKSLGFIAVGFSFPDTPLFYPQFCAWIAAGNHGDMSWMAKHQDLRRDPESLLKGCRTIVSLAYPYSPEKPCTPEGFSVSRYADPRKEDYHDRLRKKGKILIRAIGQEYPGAKSRVCVDSAPILERSFAYASGMGFIGKNNMLIVPGHGSYLFLVEILTTVSISFPDAEPVKSLCGSCTKCLDACPTGALQAPYWVNASRCLSYLTIEKKGGIDRETGRKMGQCFFGCDVCQEVCPHNRGEKTKVVTLPSVNTILNMRPEDFDEAFGKTALARAGLEKIRRSIVVLVGGNRS